MVRPTRAGFLAGLLVLAASGRADPPKLTGTAPLGVQRGKPTEVTFRGSGLVDRPRLFAPFICQLEESAGEGGRGGRLEGPADRRWPDCGRGLSRPRRDGLGGIQPDLVRGRPGTAGPEVEPNNTFEVAQPIPSPVVVEGECSGNDEDFFRFAGRKGDRIVVDAVCARIGSGVDPMIRLTTADRRLVASADDTPGLFTDGYLTAVLPRTGSTSWNSAIPASRARAGRSIAC